MELITIKELLKRNVDKYRNQIAFQMRGDSGYRKITFQQVAEQVEKVQGILLNQGVVYQDRVALISENCPEWAISYIAIVSLGAIVVPLDAMLSKEEILPLLNDSGAKTIIYSEKFTGYFAGGNVPIGQVKMEDFDNVQGSSQLPDVDVKPEDTAAIVYTSGTTGIPKGVVLTHKNIMSNVCSVSSLFDLGPKDNFLSVLPLHHTFETTAGFLGPFYNGCRITYAESLKSNNILKNMQETGVTVMNGVPLLFQLFYNGILREVEEKGKGKLFSVLFGISRFFKRVVGINVGRKLFSVVHKKFGGKIRFFVSGGAAIDPGLLENFDLMGFTIYQGYGLTESSPILTCNYTKSNKPGAVGKVIPGVEIRISGSELAGEILAFGPNIMKGYYKRKELASRVVVNGWLHTGDVGYLDEDGFLYITGRSKDVIVTASGVNVYPEEVEHLLKNIPGIKEVCVMGTTVTEGLRKGTEEVFAIIVPDFEYLEKHGYAEEVTVYSKIKEEIDGVNRKMADYKRIAKFKIRKEELPKTRLMKIKRFELKKELGK
ncbi:MAG: AMP-dependent synthetase/ligase [Candidatus Margulisiibacteriota bacterium]|nr:AMP-dependent synthetase/ligase [Candidatus Margulisiibacteriota bacterium]